MAVLVTGQSMIKATPVPSALAEVGVRIGLDEASGMAIVVIPPEVREKVNVLDPVSSFSQADPNWTPAIRLVQLTADLHSYPIQGKRGLNKQGLELLARAGGILYSRVDRVKRDELSDDEPWAYRATIGVRRSDGTIDEVTRERSAGEDANDSKFGREKTQSKAVLRAIRAALQIPHAFTAADFAKPFLVVGYSFTPDMQDADTRRMLVAVGLNAQAAIYGPGATSSEETPAQLPAGTDAQLTERTTTSPPPPAEQSTVGATQQAAAAAPGPDDLLDGEPGPEDEPSAFQAPASAQTDEDPIVFAAKFASQIVVPIGQWQGKTLKQVHEAGAKGVSWFKYALKNFDANTGTGENAKPRMRPGELVQAIEAFSRVYVPDEWQAAMAAKELS